MGPTKLLSNDKYYGLDFSLLGEWEGKLPLELLLEAPVYFLLRVRVQRGSIINTYAVMSILQILTCSILI